MERLALFIDMLQEIIEFAICEENNINSGKASSWSVSQLENVVLPEMNELLAYALNGKVLFKYGKSQRLLESTYLLTDSIGNLNNTVLGGKITELQRLYNCL